MHLFLLRSLQKYITNNRVIALQNIQISKKLIHTLMHQDLAVILMDTPGYFCYFYIFSYPYYYVSLNLIHVSLKF